jgi:hypothetical protein
MRDGRAGWWAAGGCVLLAAATAAAQPANDACSAAPTISAGSSVTGTTTGATSDLAASGCSLNDLLDVWYTFTPPATGDYFLHTNASVGMDDTTLSVFDSCGGSLLFCDDDAGFGNLSSLIASLSAGVTVKIRVSGYDGASGGFALHVSNVIAAGGADLCAAATTVQANRTYRGENISATSDVASTTCAAAPGNDSQDVWFAFTPTSTAEYRLDTDGSPSLLDTTLSIWTACGGTQLYCDDDAGSGTLSALAVVLNSGTTYRLRVAGWNGSAGEFLLNIGPPVPPATAPPNDPCSGAQLIATVPGTAMGTTIGATSDVGSASCNAVSNDPFDVWYRFTAVATPTGRTMIEITEPAGSLADTTLAVYSACGGSELFCDDDGGSGFLSRVFAPLNVGTEYRVRVAGYAGSRGTFTIRVVPEPPALSNEICGTARTISGSINETIDTSFAASELDEPAGSCNAGAATGVQNSVWYTFTSGTGGPLTGSITNIYNAYDMIAVLYTGPCGAATLTEVACWDEPEPMDLATPDFGSSVLTSGTTYYLVIGDWGAAGGGAPTQINATVPGSAVSGACCRGTTCAVSAGAACTGINTLYSGDGTTCNAPGNNTTPCCKANYNQVGGVTVQDIFDFLAGYFTGNTLADINGSGSVTVQDIFDFLAAYFVGCV